MSSTSHLRAKLHSHSFIHVATDFEFGVYPSSTDVPFYLPTLSFGIVEKHVENFQWYVDFVVGVHLSGL